MHLNGELEPLVLVEVLSDLSGAGAVDVDVGSDKFVFISCIIDSRVLYCRKDVNVSDNH